MKTIMIGVLSFLLWMTPAHADSTWGNMKWDFDVWFGTGVITPSAKNIYLSEPNTSAELTIGLNSPPASPVTVNLSTACDEITIPSSVTMDDNNWNGMEVTVGVIDDDIVDGTQTCKIVTSPASSDDGNFRGKDPDDITVQVFDNEQHGIIVDAPRLTIQEGRPGETITLWPSKQPSHPVTVHLKLQNGQCTVSSSPLVFTSQTAQHVSVTAVDDGKMDGNQPCGLVISCDTDDESFDCSEKTLTFMVEDNNANINIKSVYPTVALTSTTTTFTIQGYGFTEGFVPRVTDVSILGNGGETFASGIDVLDNGVMMASIPAPAAEGSYGLRVYVDSKDSEAQDAISLVDTLPAYKAVIVLGRAGPNAPVWEPSRDTAHLAYRTLLESGFLKENIHYLSAEGNIDLDGDREANDWDGEATLTEVQNAIDSCAGGDPADQFVLFMIGDGYQGHFRLNEAEKLDADVLYGWLSGPLASAVQNEMIIFYDACYSGSFIPYLANLANRVIITGTDADSLAYIKEGHHFSFSTFFWHKIFARYKVGPAFDYAQAQMMDQTPMIEYTAGINLDALSIGRGGIPMTDTPIVNHPPGPWMIPQGETTDMVEIGPVVDGQGIGTMWAIVRSPCGRNKEVVFTVQSATGYYEGLIDRLIFNGEYAITINAVDTQEYLREQPIKTSITKSDGVQCHQPDLTLDGTIDLADAILGLKILSGAPYGENPEGNYEKLDIDMGGNQYIGLEEVVYILSSVGN